MNSLLGTATTTPQVLRLTAAPLNPMAAQHPRGWPGCSWHPLLTPNTCGTTPSSGGQAVPEEMGQAWPDLLPLLLRGLLYGTKG